MFGGCGAEIEKGQNCRNKRQDMNSFTGTPGVKMEIHSPPAAGLDLFI